MPSGALKGWSGSSQADAYSADLRMLKRRSHVKRRQINGWGQKVKCHWPLLSFIYISLCGCVGAGVVATSNEEVYSPTDSFPTNRRLKPQTAGQIRSLQYDQRYVDTGKRYNSEEVKQLWGSPDETSSKDGFITWTYYEQPYLWHGLVLHVLVTIPLVIPMGKARYTLSFKNDQLEKIAYRATKTHLFVCDPAYMYLKGLAASMPSTGNGSAVGPCTLINRKGLYFHHLMNY